MTMRGHAAATVGVLIALGAGLAAFAQDAEPPVQARISTTDVRIGDPVQVSLRPACGSEVLSIGVASGATVGPFTVTSVSRADAPQGGGCAPSWTIVLVTLDANATEVPPIQVRYRAPSQPPAVLTTDPLRVSVSEPVPDLSQPPKGLKPAVALAGPGRRTAIAGALLLAIGALLVLAARSRRPSGARRVDRSDDVSGLIGELRELRGAAIDVHEFHVRVSRVLRQILQRRRQVPAMALSSTELVDALRPSEPPDRVSAMTSVLTAIDRAKFGGEVPPDLDRAELVGRVEGLVTAQGRPR
jgi:hypothetical protein